MNDRDRKIAAAEQLFDSIGMIEDFIIADAANYQVERKKRVPYMRRFVALAATLAVLAVSMIGTFLIAKYTNDGSNMDGADDMQTPTTAQDKLGSTLDLAGSTSLALRKPLADIDFFDGQTNLIWQFEGESDYHVFALSSSVSELKRELSKANEQMSRESADEIDYRVWVSYGNGEVVSPHLKENAGNVGYAELFEYSPEVVPSEGFEKLINEATKK